MRWKILIILLSFALLTSNAQEQIYKVKKLKGEAQVRHGTRENWQKLSTGDTLRADDTIILQKDGYIEIEAMNIFFKSNGAIILNISDLRRLSKEDLLLQLAFEEMKNIPDVKVERKNAKSTGIYGSEISKREVKPKEVQNLTHFWVGGVKALFENGFYETSAIRAKNLMLKFSELKDDLDLKMLVATSLEKIGLYGEAIAEYRKIISTSNDESLNSNLERKIRELKSKIASNGNQQ